MNRHDPHPARRAFGPSASVFALLAGIAITLFCARTIHDVAQMPAGDGTGMQWVVLTPLTLLFLLVGVPALIVGITGLRRPSSPEALEAARQTRKRAFRVLFWVQLAVLILPCLAPIVFGLLMLLGVVD